MSAQWLNTIGLVSTILGVLGLFRYGMPFHVPTGGATFLITESKDQQEIDRERLYGRLAYAALALVIVGTGFQIWATWAP